MIRWTPTALKQFKAIHRWIAADNPEAARHQCLLITDALQHLEKFPNLGPQRRSPEEREYVVPGTPYTIFYRLRNQAIFVRSIRHAARLRPRRFQK